MPTQSQIHSQVCVGYIYICVYTCTVKTVPGTQEILYVFAIIIIREPVKYFEYRGTA